MKRYTAIWLLACVAGVALLTGGCNKGASANAITVTIMPTATVSVDEGQMYTFAAVVKNDYTNSGVIWEVYNDKTTVPVSCTIPSCGTLVNQTAFSATYVAPTGVLGTTKVSVQATAAALFSATAVATVTIVLPPVINTLSLPNGQNGVPYRQTISETGGVSPLTYSVSAGQLPAGLSIGAGGVINGTPSGSGTSQFTIQVADSGSPPIVVTQAYTITISPPPPLSIATTSPLPQGVVGAEYSEAITANGGIPPLTWSIIGTLPAGLTFTENTITGGSTTPVTTGQISGIPLSAGTFTFSVQVYDSSIPEQIVTAPFSLTINPPPPLVITTASLPGGTTALGYSTVVQATGGAAPYTFSTGPGLLPPGLTLNSSTGTITGTPVRAATSNFAVTVTDSEVPPVSVSKDYSIAIAANTNVLQEYELLDGPYAFLFTGYGKFNSITEFPEVIAGVMSASGTGAISGGTEDVSSNGVLPDLSFTGNYSVGTDGRGSMTLTVTGPSGQKILQSYQLALDAEGNGQFIEDDNTGSRGSGILLKQSTSAFTAVDFAGNYAFDWFGFDSTLKRMATVGQFHADGSSTLSDGTADVNDNGTVTTYGINGSFSNLNAAGRGSASLFFSPNTQTYFFYLVSPSEAIFLMSGASTTNGTTTTELNIGPVGGIAYLEEGNPFSGETLNGNFVVTGTGTDSASDSSIFGSLMTFTPSGAAGGGTTPLAFAQNDGGTISTTLPSAAQYSVNPSGRTQFTGGTTRMGIAYIVSASQAVYIGTDSEVTSGMIDLQPGGQTFTLPFLQGEFTLNNPTTADSQATDVSGVPVADGAGNLTGEIDYVTGNDTQTLAAALTATYTLSSNGTGAVTNGSGAGLPASLELFMITPEQIRLISTDPTDSHPTVFFLDY